MRPKPGSGAMTSVWFSVPVGILVFASGSLGLYLKKLLPDTHVEAARAMIAAVIGLLTLLLALVLGNIIGSVHGFYVTQKSELDSLATEGLQLDMALAEYGDETKELRARLKEEMTESYKMFWGRGNAADSTPDALKITAALPNLRAIDAYLTGLNPQTPSQRQAVSTAETDARLIKNLRIKMSLQLASPVSWPLLVIVPFWSILLFCGFGLVSPTNATTVIAMGLGASAVASAVFIIIELSHPYTGIFRIPPSALEQTIDAIDQ
jgi:hypothetical protein